MIVDAHCHVGLRWREPVETLRYHMAKSGVDKAVLTSSTSAEDLTYELECRRRFPGTFAVVGSVTPEQAGVEAAVASLAESGVAGIRLRSPGESLSLAGYSAALASAAELGLAVTVLGDSSRFVNGAFEQLVAANPNATVIIEHLGSTAHPDDDAATRERVFTLAAYPNVHMKIAGLGEFCRPDKGSAGELPFADPIPPFLERAHAAFGSDRLLWGSDFPNVCSREGYERALAWPRQRFQHLGDAECAAIFGGTAARLFGLADLIAPGDRGSMP
jgi:L-fuconolactonase